MALPVDGCVGLILIAGHAGALRHGVCVGRVSELVGVSVCTLVHSDQLASSKLSALTDVCDSLQYHQ